MAPAFLELDGVGKQYGPVTAVQDVTIRVAQGEFLGLLGPSGCGKTTTLRMLAGLEHPTSGQILYEGADITHELETATTARIDLDRPASANRSTRGT